MNHSDIELFLLVVKTGSISAAAQNLFISQPALSRKLKSLESKLAVRLFERGRGEHNVQLTPAGKAFFPIAEKWNRLIQETRELPFIDQMLPTFSIDAVGTVATGVLVPVFHQFSLDHPEIHLRITRHHSSECYDVINQNNASLGFVTEDQYYQNVETHPAFKENMVLLARNDSFFHQDIHPKELDVRHEIHIPWNSEYSQWHNFWFPSSSKPLISIWDISQADLFLSDRNNWIIVPYSIALNYCKNKPNYASYRLSAPPSDRIVYYLIKSGSQNEYIPAFLNQVHSQLRNMTGIRSFLFDFSCVE